MFFYGFLSHFVHSFPTFTARDTNFCISSDIDNKIILVEALDQIKKGLMPNTLQTQPTVLRKNGS